MFKDPCSMIDALPPKRFPLMPVGKANTIAKTVEQSLKNETSEEIGMRSKQKRAVMGYPSLKEISSQPQLESDQIHSKLTNGSEDNIENDNMTRAQYFLEKGLMITTKTLSRLRIRILPNRKLCFVGKMPRGVFMPTNYWLQYLIIKRIILWYFPCIRIQGSSYYILNNACYKTRENEFLRMFLKTQKQFLESKLSL